MADIDMTSQGAASPFRLSPPSPNRELVLRPRLLEILGGRFDRRLTVLVGGAGFGKTSLLVQALDQNVLDPHGLDVWLGCASGDGAAPALAAGILAALDLPGERDREPVESIVAEVWSRAPEQVCLVLDDVHQVDADSSASELLDRLLQELPENGHLLLAGRVSPPIRTAKLEAAGELAVVGEDALAFDDDEEESFAELRHVDIGAMAGAGGWPALSELHVSAPRSATGEYLWEEVLDSLGPDQRDAVIRLGPFEAIDDELLDALTDGPMTIADVAAAIPLAKLVKGTVRIHDLWRSVLLDAIPGADLPAGWHRPAVGVLRAQGRYREAFDALMQLDDVDGTAELVDELSRVDFPDLHTDDLMYVLKRLPTELADSGSVALIRGTMLLGVDASSALDAYDAALARFRADEDLEAQTIAQFRRANVMFLAGDLDGMAAVIGEFALLAQAGVAQAGRVLELAGAFAQMMAGAPLDAIAAIEQGGVRGDPALSSLGGFLVANAWLEHGHARRALAEAESGVDRTTGQLRIALQSLIIEAQTILNPGDGDRQEEGFLWLISQAAVLEFPGSVATTTAGYATWLASHGRLDEARDRHGEAQAALAGVAGPHFVLTVSLAELVLALVSGDEEGARAVGRRTLDEVPMGARPDRAYLVVFDAVYVLLPETRALLDELDLGPDYATHRTASQAIVRLRDDDDLAPAAALPWETPAVLKRSVLEPLLVELVVAASVSGVDRAAGMLDDLSFDPHQLLRRVADRYDGSMAKEAGRLLRRVPARPADPISIAVLGPLELRRCGAPVEDPSWGRERVRSLLLYLVDSGHVRRERVAAALWGDRDDDAAANNLRVTLNHLQQVLQPDRDRDTEPFFLRADGDYLGLIEDDLLVVDVHQFERRIADAARAEAERVPSLELDHLLAAVALYRGPYLIDGADWDWGYYDRIRLQSLFVESAVRAGELVLARGEAREADRLAMRAAEVEPLAEPPHRLRARALAAAGDRAAARSALAAVVADLRGEDLEPDPATIDLLERL